MFKKTFISSNPKISVKFCGKGELVIFLHGIGGNKNNWDQNLPEISKSFLCVAWDTRGYGESDDYDGPLDFNDVIEDLKKVIFHFKKKQALIVGLSMGGQIACFFYEKYPSLVKSLILCDTHFGLNNLNANEIKNFINSRKDPLINGKEPKDIAKKVAESLIGNKCNKTALNKLIESISMLHKESYIKTIDASFAKTHAHIFKIINVPTLIIVGELDRLTPIKMAKKIKSIVKDSKLSIIPNAGHLSNIEQPKIFNEILFNFLKNVTL